MKEQKLIILTIFVAICIANIVETRSCPYGKSWNGAQCGKCSF
jgi:hypothetical protein